MRTSTSWRSRSLALLLPGGSGTTRVAACMAGGLPFIGPQHRGCVGVRCHGRTRESPEAGQSMKKTAFPAKGSVPYRRNATGRRRRLRRAVGAKVAKAEIGPTPVTIAVWDPRRETGDTNRVPLRFAPPSWRGGRATRWGVGPLLPDLAGLRPHR